MPRYNRISRYRRYGSIMLVRLSYYDDKRLWREWWILPMVKPGRLKTPVIIPRKVNGD